MIDFSKVDGPTAEFRLARDAWEAARHDSDGSFKGDEAITLAGDDVHAAIDGASVWVGLTDEDANELLETLRETIGRMESEDDWNPAESAIDARLARCVEAVRCAVLPA
ncbi:MAG: hypothetical protein GY953_42200 [bacterium]|nr:hypothetical protein [bacterium]